MPGNTKSPVSLVSVGAVFVPYISLMSVTVAPGMTPPCASFTEPKTVAVLTCAATGRAIAQSSTANARVARPCLTLAMMTSSSDCVRRLTSGIRRTPRSGRLVSHRIEIPRIPALDTSMRPFEFELREVWKEDRENTSTRGRPLGLLCVSDRSDASRKGERGLANATDNGALAKGRRDDRQRDRRRVLLVVED